MQALFILGYTLLLAIDLTSSLLLQQRMRTTVLTCQRFNRWNPMFMNEDGWILSDQPYSSSIVHSDFTLTDGDRLKFARSGYVRLPKVLEKESLIPNIRAEAMQIFNSNKLTALRHKIRVTFGSQDFQGNPIHIDTLSTEECENLLLSIDQADIPFLQLFNVWKKSKVMSSIGLSPDLAKVAADLLGAKAVRLYQDALFIKRPGDGPTNWHSDLNMAPFDTNDFITCWIPLQDIPAEEAGGSGLVFATASHRDVAFPFWWDPRETDCEGRYEVEPAPAMVRLSYFDFFPLVPHYLLFLF